MESQSIGGWSVQLLLSEPFVYFRKDDQIEYEFDSTGIFHWCPARPFTDVLVSRWEKIILCQKTYMEITK